MTANVDVERSTLVLPNTHSVTAALSLCFLAMTVPVRAQVKQFTIPELVREMGPGIVYVAAQNAAGQSISTGTGFVVKTDGVIVTNYHIVEGAEAVAIKTPDGEIYDRAQVLDYDIRRDILLLKIRPFRPLQALRLTSDDELEVGQDAVAIGNPQGLEHTVSEGIVSGYRQAEGFRLIQTTVPVSPGSSGSPLFNLRGEVIGVTTSTIGGQEAQRLNFAVPAVYVLPLVETATEPISLPEMHRRAAGQLTLAVQPRADVRRRVPPNKQVWRVVLAMGGGFSGRRSGTLVLTDASVTFNADGEADVLELVLRQITEVKRNNWVGWQERAFHVTLEDGRNYNFAALDERGKFRDSNEVVAAIYRALAERGR